MSGVDTARAETATRWWWVRHAPVRVNKGHLYGQMDLPCDTGDTAAFRRLAAWLPPGAQWVVSNLQRTHQTASAIIAAGRDGPDRIPGPDVHVVADFAEQSFGDWQGRSYASLAERSPEDYHRFWVCPARRRPPGGESFADLQARVARGIGMLDKHFIGRDVIAVTHGGTIRAAIALALGLEPEAVLSFAVDNLALTRLDCFHDPDGKRVWRVDCINRVPE
jgi:alpha-ribazole phosphatase